MRRLLLAAALGVAACGAPTSNGSHDGAGSPGSSADGGADLDLADLAAPGGDSDLAVRTASGTYTFVLDAGAFPPTTAHPSALVYLPSGWRAQAPLAVIVYLHGFYNCVENIVRDAGASCDPAAGTPARQAYALAAQLETSGRNAIFIAPELAFDQATGNPGTLGTAGGLRALLSELFVDLEPTIGHFTVDDIGTLAVASHSGGYQAAAGIASQGGVRVDELWLFDSLYGNTSTFDAWVKQDLGALAAPPGGTPARRFADVYTSGGGTLANSQAMATRAATWVPADAGILVDDRTTATWPDATYRHGLLFKLSGLSHDGVPRYYFERMLSTSSLPAK